jgi:hypothetical protein
VKGVVWFRNQARGDFDFDLMTINAIYRNLAFVNRSSNH